MPYEVAYLLVKINRSRRYDTSWDLNMLLIRSQKSTETTVTTLLGAPMCCSFACKYKLKLLLRHSQGPQHVAQPTQLTPFREVCFV